MKSKPVSRRRADSVALQMRARAAMLFALFMRSQTWAEPSAHLLNLNIEDLGAIKIDTVFAASKVSEKVTDAPSSVTIVTRDEIRRFGYRTLGDIVRSVRSFDVTYDREYSYTTARGYSRLTDYGTRTLLLIDGHRMNDPLFSAASVGTESLLDVDLIERVEFIRGPGSAIYGSNAFFAVINVVPRKGASIDGVETAGSFGSFDAHSGRITVGKKFATGIEMLLSATTYESDGNHRLFYKEFDAPETNHGIADRRDGDRFWSFFGSAAWGDFTIEGGYVAREKESPTASFGALFNTPVEDVDTRGYAELRYTHETADGWKTSARTFYDSYDYHSLGRYDSENPGVVSNDSARQHWWGAEASVGRELSFLNGFRFTMGTEYRRTLQLRRRGYDEVSPHVFNDINDREEVLGVYLDTHTQLLKPLGLAAGVRWDYYDTFGDTLNPRVGLIYKPAERTTLKLLYGQAFRAPDFDEGKYGVRPEAIRTYEIVGEQYFDAHWHATGSVFQNAITDLIGFASSDDNAPYANVGEACVRGAEIEIEGKSDRGWLLRGSYTRQHAEDEKNGRLENSPTDIAKIQLGAPLHGERVTANLELLYVGDRLTLQGRHSGDTVLVNATLFARELLPGLECSASLYNALDTRYRVPGGVNHTQDTIEQDGRTFRLKLSYKF